MSGFIGEPSQAEELEALRAESVERATRLEAQGLGVPLIRLCQWRLDALVETLWPDENAPERLAFEVAFETRLINELTEAEKKLARSRLVVP